MGPFLDEGKEVSITALPLYHIFALVVNSLLFLKLGCRNVLLTNPRDMKGFVAELKNSGFTAISGVNTLFNGLLHTPRINELDFSKIKLAVGGSTALQRAVPARWKQDRKSVVTGKSV